MPDNAEKKTAIHHIKCHPTTYHHTVRGEKNFEVRFNDRDYRCGDEVVMHEWDPGLAAKDGREAGGYTGREVRGTISYVLDSTKDDALRRLKGERSVIQEGYVVFGVWWKTGVAASPRGA
jgi:hypothetical protein